MYTWSENKDDEWWNKDEFDTEKECVEDATQGYGFKPGDTIAIGRIYTYEPHPDIYTLLDRMEEDAYEECGEAAESWNISDRSGREKEYNELYQGVEELVNEYLDKIGEKPGFFRVDSIHTVDIKAEQEEL